MLWSERRFIGRVSTCQNGNFLNFVYRSNEYSKDSWLKAFTASRMNHMTVPQLQGLETESKLADVKVGNTSSWTFLILFTDSFSNPVLVSLKTTSWLNSLPLNIVLWSQYCRFLLVCGNGQFICASAVLSSACGVKVTSSKSFQSKSGSGLGTSVQCRMWSTWQQTVRLVSSLIT